MAYGDWGSAVKRISSSPFIGGRIQQNFENKAIPLPIKPIIPELPPQQWPPEDVGPPPEDIGPPGYAVPPGPAAPNPVVPPPSKPMKIVKPPGKPPIAVYWDSRIGDYAGLYAHLPSIKSPSNIGSGTGIGIPWGAAPPGGVKAW